MGRKASGLTLTIFETWQQGCRADSARTSVCILFGDDAISGGAGLRATKYGSNRLSSLFQSIAGKFQAFSRFPIIATLQVLLTTLVLAVMAPVCQAAGNVTLAWDAGNTPGLRGYKIYYGTASGVYTNWIEVGNVTQYAVGELLSGLTYYFAVTAFDENNESGYSDEISYTVPLADSDGDGVGDSDDVFPLNPLEWADTDGDGLGNNADFDDDNDGMPDAWEITHQLNPLINDAAGDEDGDGTSNLNEYATGGNPLLPEPNRAPDVPLLLSPVGGETISATVQLQIDDFSDPDFGDSHSGTQWQIVQATDDHCVFDVTSTTAVTSLVVPRLILEEDTEYYWRARYYDSHGVPSEWSQSGFFATEYLGGDGDGNGVPDDQEVGTAVDLDRDGIPDYEQADIRCVELAGNKTQIGVSARYSGSPAEVLSLAYEDPGAIGAGIGGSNQPVDIPFGLINFKVLVGQPGDEAIITVYFSKPAPKDTVWYKYDPVEGNWVDFSAYSRMSANRKTIQLTLIDGGEGDADGIANGIIVDPAGLVIPPDSVSFSDASDSVGDAMGLGGCFISASADQREVSVSGSWRHAARGREAAIGFAILMLLLAGRCAAGHVAQVIRAKMQLVVGARLRS